MQHVRLVGFPFPTAERCESVAQLARFAFNLARGRPA